MKPKSTLMSEIQKGLARNDKNACLKIAWGCSLSKHILLFAALLWNILLLKCIRVIRIFFFCCVFHDTLGDLETEFYNDM